jgi:hypothetical protein
MTGFYIMFWAVPVMTIGQLFSTVATLYILLAVEYLEEPDSVEMIGDKYKESG